MTLALSSSYTPDREWGFLNNEAQTTALPDIYASLDNVAKRMGDLLREKQLRPCLANTNPIEVPDGLSQSQYRKLLTIYGMLSSAYIFSIYEYDIKTLPKSLSVPLHDVGRRLGMPPILNYDAYVYNNWRVIPGATDFCLPESYEPLYTFSSLKDPEHEGEKWFIVIHVAAEKAIASVVSQLSVVQAAMANGDRSSIKNILQEFKTCLTNAGAVIGRMLERLDPNSYAFTTRKYVFPFNDIVFEGVNEFQGKPQSLRGETGGQSPFPRAMGAFLGIQHKSVDMAELGYHMLPDHQAYVARLKTSPPVSSYLDANPELRDLYNDVVDTLANFRHGHMRMAAAYLSAYGFVAGTGKSTFDTYLAENRRETLAAKAPAANLMSRLVIDNP